MGPDNGGDNGGGNGGGSNAAPDQDQDGVPDARDNCRMAANPAQYNEDGDAFGDACDNCPHVSNNDQQNTGETGAGNAADLVGDACDPRPTEDGDQIALFVGFNQASDVNGWGQAGPGGPGTFFTVTDGVLRGAVTDDLTLAWRNDADLLDATLVTKVKYTAISPTYRWRGFSIVGNFVRDATRVLGAGAGCGEMRDSNVAAGAPRFNAVDYTGGTFSNGLNTAGAQLAVGQISVYEARLSDDEVQCRKGTVAWSRALSRRGQGIALSAWGVGVDIEYVVAFKSND